MQKRLLVGTLFLVGFMFLGIPSVVTNYKFFSLDEIFSRYHLENRPEQMPLGMRSLQASQVQASPSTRCDMSFNNTALPTDSSQFQNYLFYAYVLLEGGKATYNIQFSTER